jgi:S-formylglutathione hydrolase FrmB
MKNHFNFVFTALIFLLTLTSCVSIVPHVVKDVKIRDVGTLLCFKSNAIGRGRLEPKRLGKICVSIPDSYVNSPERRYPVIYALPGFGDSALSMIEPIRQDLKEMHNQTEFIIVSIDGGNCLGGSFFSNSPATGNWEDLVVQEAVTLTDSRYRTIAEPQGRMLAGFSMGGFAAWNIALKHPDVFCAVWACCPGAWDENGLKDTLKSWDSTYKNAYGAAFSPDITKKFPFARIPKFNGTAEDAAVISGWEQGFGGIHEKLSAYQKKNIKLTSISFAFGSHDPYPWIPRGTKYIAQAMADAGLPVAIKEYQSGHEMTDTIIRTSFIPDVDSVFAGKAVK